MRTGPGGRLSSRSWRRLLAACGICCLLAAAPACGKKGSPLPPLRTLPETAGELRVRQVGGFLIVSFTPPRTRTDGSSLGGEATLEILVSAREPAPRRPADLVDNPAATWVLPRADWRRYAQGRRLDVSLSLPTIAGALAGESGAPGLKGRMLSFVVQAIEPRRRRSEPSTVATLRVCEPPERPSGLHARLVEEGLLLQWDPASGPPSPVRHRVYRQERPGPSPDRPLGAALAEGTAYLDRDAISGRPYRYLLRRAGELETCESADAEPLEVAWIDLFPPAPPQGLAAVTEQGAIRLFWRPNREPDLRGYRVWRADGSDSPMRLLTPEDLTSTSYTDEDVVPGIAYVYAVTARDSAARANESEFSAQAIERMGGGS